MTKGIVFFHTCNNIVGDSFPVNYGHDFGNSEMATKMLFAGQTGLGLYKDTPKIRKRLAKEYPPRTEVTIKL